MAPQLLHASQQGLIGSSRSFSGMAPTAAMVPCRQAQCNMQGAQAQSSPVQRRQHAGCQAALPESLSDGAAVGPAAALAAVVLPIAGIAGWRFSLYSQLEVITARMLGSFVPGDATQVVQLNGETRDLYYYPKRIGQVTVVGEKIAAGLFEQAGMQASMPTRSRKQPCSNLGFIPDSSVDALVSLGAISSLDDKQKQAQALAEICRVLKPGAPLIFIEPLTDGASPLRGLISSGSAKAMAASALEDLLDRRTLDVLQVDVALQGSDPHAVGVAKRTATAARQPGQASSEPEPEDVVRAARRGAKKQGSGSQGFKKLT